MTIQSRIGIDIGRVIIADDTDPTTSFFSREFLKAPAVPDAIATIARIAARFGPENVFLVSKCGPATAQRSLQWLHHQYFFALTGIQPEQVHFCAERHEKKFICDALEIDIFIDDRYTVLMHLEHLSQLFLFDPSNGERKAFKSQKHTRRNIRLVENWQEVAQHLRL